MRATVRRLQSLMEIFGNYGHRVMVCDVGNGDDGITCMISLNSKSDILKLARD